MRKVELAAFIALTPLALALQGTLTAQGALAQDTAPLTRETKHFKLFCHVPSKRAADEASLAVEMVWDLSGQIYNLARIKLKKRLVVNLYADAKAFEIVEAGLTKGRFKRNQAFAHFKSRSAHVALQPPIKVAVIDSHGLPRQTLRLLAHEAAHLVRYSAMRNHESHPRWLADGAASMIDTQVIGKLGLAPHPDDDPELGRVQVNIQELIKNDKLPPLENLLANQDLGLGFHQHYDYSYLFFRKLMEGPDSKAARRIFKRLRQLGGGDGLPGKLHKTVIKEIGKKRLSALETELRASITAAEPKWRQVLRSLETKGKSWRQMAFPNSNAIAWRRQPVGKKKYRVSGKLEFLPGTKTQMNLLLDHRDTGFVSIALSAGYGVTVFRFDTATKKWNRLMSENVAALRLNETVAFTVKVDGTKIDVHVAGKSIGRIDVGGEPLVGPWGLGAQNGSVGIWHDLKAPGLK